MKLETLLYEVKQGVCIISLNRPHRLNTLSRQFYADLNQAVDAAEMDDSVRVVMITGVPREDGRPCFCAGVDLKEQMEQGPQFATNVNDAVLNLMAGQTLYPTNAIDKLESITKPTIAAVDGICTTGGLEIILACDLRVVSETAEISELHVKALGVAGGGAVPVRLALLVGPSAAKDIVLTGKVIDGKEAHRLGLANYIYPSPELMSGAWKLAQELASRPIDGLRFTKAQINAAMYMDPKSAIRFSQLCRASCSYTQDTMLAALHGQAASEP